MSIDTIVERLEAETEKEDFKHNVVMDLSSEGEVSNYEATAAKNLNPALGEDEKEIEIIEGRQVTVIEVEEDKEGIVFEGKQKIKAKVIAALRKVTSPNTYIVQALRIVAGRRDKYLQMFNKVLKEEPEKTEEVDREISFAMEKLKTEDRVMWYLRKIKAGLLDSADEEYKAVKKEINDILHYLNNAEVNNYSSIKTYRFPPKEKVDRVVYHLINLELDEQEKRKGKLTKKDRLLDPDLGDTSEVSVFKDMEGGWQWHLIDAPHCELEGRAMDHCGNTGQSKPGDQVLSLREPVEYEGKKYYQPHATFIVNNGVLGEMKGFKNQKPSSKLHPYIVELLLDDNIKFIAGGGYKPESNFNIDDLDSKLKKQVLDEKPELGGDFIHYYQTKGADEYFNSYLQRRLDSDTAYADPKQDLIYLYVYDSLEDYASAHDDALSSITDEIESPESYHYEDAQREDLLEELRKKSRKYFEEFKEKLSQEFRREFDSHFDEDQDKINEFVEKGDGKELLEFAEDEYIDVVLDPVDDTLSKMVSDAARSAASMIEEYGDDNDLVFVTAIGGDDAYPTVTTENTKVGVASPSEKFFEFLNKNKDLTEEELASKALEDLATFDYNYELDIEWEFDEDVLKTLTQLIEAAWKKHYKS